MVSTDHGERTIEIQARDDTLQRCGSKRGHQPVKWPMKSTRSILLNPELDACWNAEWRFLAVPWATQGKPKCSRPRCAKLHSIKHRSACEHLSIYFYSAPWVWLGFSLHELHQKKVHSLIMEPRSAEHVPACPVSTVVVLPTTRRMAPPRTQTRTSPPSLSCSFH